MQNFGVAQIFLPAVQRNQNLHKVCEKYSSRAQDSPALAGQEWLRCCKGPPDWERPSPGLPILLGSPSHRAQLFHQPCCQTRLLSGAQKEAALTHPYFLAERKQKYFITGSQFVAMLHSVARPQERTKEASGLSPRHRRL